MPKTPKKTSLNSVEQYELNQWLQQNNINPAKLRRSFTDVMPLARLLSRYYPDLVDVNYYPPRNSIQSKLSNWQLFSKRVLNKMGVRVTREEMDRVARCVPGSIDLLLFSIMCAHNATVERRKRANHDSDTANNDDDDEADDDGQSNASEKTQEPPQPVPRDPANLKPIRSNNASKHSTQIALTPNMSNLRAGPVKSSPSLGASESTGIANATAGVGSSVRLRMGVGPMEPRNTSSVLSRKKPIVEDKDVVVVNVRKQIGDLVCEQPQKMVLYSVYAQAADNLQQKSVNIARYLQRNAHLESMLQLKAERIEELQQRINLLQDESRKSKKRSARPPLAQPKFAQISLLTLGQAINIDDTVTDQDIKDDEQSLISHA